MTPPSDTIIDAPAAATPRRSRLWLWIVAAFVVQLGVWAGWIVFASRHPVAEVPLATEPRAGGAR
jgi:hypothetical protein